MSGATPSDADFIAAVLPAFISEATEQLENIEHLLLQLEVAPDDRDLLDALFRCAHTVKGSAGIFGLDRVVGFTHHVEGLLDRLREGTIALDPALSTLLLRCNDQIRTLVGLAGDDTPPTADEEANIAALVAALRAVGGATETPGGSSSPVTMPATQLVGARRWHVSVRFGRETYRNGMDPLASLNYLRTLGEIVAIGCDVEAIPELDTLDPEACYLGFEFGFETAATRDEIDGAFSFVREDIALQIIEPDASPDAFVALIDALPQSTRLGEILITVGAITRDQLQQGLEAQAAGLATGNAVPRLGDILSDQAGLHPTVVKAALNKQQERARDPQAPVATEDQRFIRVQADRLDTVINLLGELVTAGAGASLLARQTRQGTLIEAHAQITRLIEEIRNSTLQLRMVPIGETFARFRRAVRDTAAELGKEVLLDIVGGDAELDKSVVERIADPLMHLVRNALDHGLESAAVRAAQGKPAQGRLTLAARHESGNILITISDDGRGIDRPRVLARAWERGLVEQGVTPSEADIDKLIFEPGFSTAETVTNLSGRGVGMDVVRRNIEALRGSVTLQSTPGQGAQIEIRLPLTLAIIDGFLVSVGPSKFIFPLESVVEVIETRPAVEEMDASGRSFVALRGQTLPVVDLRRLYGLDSVEPERISVVVVKAGNSRMGVMVDQLLGQHQTVIKPLGRMFRSLRGMSGSSILGSGEVALIFDVNSLNGLAVELPSSPRAAARPAVGTASNISITEGQFR